jgi:putative intracellular protease/amidase
MAKRVLIVLTSQGTLGPSDNKTGFWLEELATPYYVLVDNGIDVTLASPRGGLPPVDPKSLDEQSQTPASRRFDKDADAQQALHNTVRLADITVDDYDAVFFPGGHGPMWDLASDADNAALVSGFYQAGKPVAAVCHGPAALTGAVDARGESILRGRKVTAFSNSEERAVELDAVVPFLLQDRLQTLGADYASGDDWGAFVQVDGKLVTGQNPASSEQAARELLQLLTQGA